jgi:hypothetical protein
MSADERMHKNIIEMKIKEISISYSVAINTGNFESEKWNVTQVAELQDGENYEDIRSHLAKDVHTYAQKLKAITKTKSKIFSSLPSKKNIVKKVDLLQEDYELENRKHAEKIK